MPILWTPEIPGMAEALSPSDSTLLAAGKPIPESEPPERVHVLGPCSSVLDVAAHLAGRDVLGPWDSVLAVRQWAGRGQLRRTWISEPGNLFAAWRLPMPPAPWQGLLPVLMGWLLCRGLGEMGADLRLKWPNDVLMDGRKVGGILIEERGEVLLAGIGLNLTSCPEDADLRADRACPAGALGGLLGKPSILGLWLRLVHFGRLRYNAILSASTPLEFSQSIEPMLAYLGSVVFITDNRSSVRGVLSGIDPDGGLVLRTDGVTRTLHCGSLTPED
ncbi:MAG: biotin--[acetyl-CoA-carboxylase] ligase [Deltaproteobacteria bacterium]|nr:biotin--[acetyl-CoA-carboxylase] ligase [Deltaproteobacteria bacterium]